MVEGFWIVQYEGVAGNGGGVVFFMKGRVLGGDSGFVYTGTYQEEGGTVAVKISVRNFLPGIASVFGIPGDYVLNVKGTLNGNTIQGTGSLANYDAMGIAVKLTKVSDLPK